MRAERLPVRYFLLFLAGFGLLGLEGVLPAGFIGPAFGDPAAQSPSAANGAPPSEDGKLPRFVPGKHALTLAGGDEAADSEPDGKPASAGKAKGAAASPSKGSTKRTVSITVEPIPGTKKTLSVEVPAWPQFTGAKNLFGAAKTSVPLPARAIGSYARGCLSGAVPLPIDGPAWQEMRLSRNRNWGHPKLIALIEQFAKDAQKLDGWPGLLVGDIAQPRGGPMMSGHASHQVGLDADIWLTPMPDRRLTEKEREDIQATSMLDNTGLAVDPKVFTEKQVALIKRATSYPEVERIFVHPAIKKALCKAAGTDRSWLGKVRPYYGHYYHFHVRIKCPAGFTGCVPQVPPTGDDGCGKEVDQWLAKVVPAKTPEVTPAPPPAAGLKPPKPPIMLSDLPRECQEVLSTGPNAVSIPREALLTTAAVRQRLAKVAAARAAAEKALAKGKAIAASDGKTGSVGPASPSGSAAAAIDPQKPAPAQKN